MSINIIHQPPSFQPVLTNGLFYTISADTTNTYKFRYTYDIYVDGQLIFQGKSTPNPSDLGVIDVSRILKTYCENNPIAVWNTTYIYTHQTFPFSAPYLDETINYQTYFGYEYSDSVNGAVTGFTGVGNAVGNPGVETPLRKTFHSTMGVNGRATQQDFNMGPFVLSGAPIGTNPTTSGLFLTNSPRTRDIQESEWYTLSFTNYYLDPTTISEPYYVEYNFYDDQGILITGVTIDNILTNGGGPRYNCLDVYPALPLVIPSGGTSYNTLYVGAGPMNLQDIIPANTAQYTVQLFGKFTGTTQPIPATPTPTPTPSPTPVFCDCQEYEVFNPSQEAQGIITFRDCFNIQQILVVNPGETYFICVCNLGDYQVQGVLTVTHTGPCLPPVCICIGYTIFNTGDEALLTVNWVDCNLANQTQTVNPGQGISICACQSTVSASGSTYTITEQGECNPTPTPTPTMTPSPTPDCLPEVVQECTSTCQGGLCFCDDPFSVNVYAPPGVLPSDIGATLYTDCGLTNVYNGNYEYGGVIYSASPVAIICTPGDPC